MFPGGAASGLAKDLPADAVVVVTRLGQSNGWGTNSWVSTQQTALPYGLPDNSSPLPGVFCWDKLKRISVWDKNGTDPNRSNEAHRFRPLTVGWGAGGGAYPWEGLPADPSIGASLQLGYRLRMATQRPVYFIDTFRGGTNLYDTGTSGDARWNVRTTGEDSLYELWRDWYWNDAMTYLVDNVLGGDASRVHLAANVWFQGAADMDTQSWADAYENNLKDLLDVPYSGQVAHPAGIRETINPTDVDAVPTVIIRSEPYYDDASAPTLGHDYVTTVRTAQETVQAAIPNSALVSCDECPREDSGSAGPGEGEHILFDGQGAMGNSLAAAILGLTWLQEPSY